MAKTRRRTVPVVGGVTATITAMATTLGAYAPATPVAVVAQGGVDGVDGAVGALDRADDGVFEPCSAYFGFGKQNGALDIVGFDVSDVSGDDGTSHAVPDDTEVVFVLENEDGDVLECIPDAVTEAEWDEEMENEFSWFPDAPAWPAHPVYHYPSVASGPFIDGEGQAEGFGRVVAVSFRVTGIPDGHTLVSPLDLKALVDRYAGTGAENLERAAHPDVLTLIEAEAGPAAAAAFAAAVVSCEADNSYDDSPELRAAVDAIDTYLGRDPAGNVGCGTFWIYEQEATTALALVASTSYIEPISLSLPTPPPPPPPPTPSTPSWPPADPSTPPDPSAPPASPPARPDPPAPPAQAAQAIAATATFTG